MNKEDLKAEIMETAARLRDLIAADEVEYPNAVSVGEVRRMCREILEAANVETLGGCPLCQS